MATRPGLYERLISEQFEEELRKLAPDLIPQRDSLRVAEAGDRLALYLARLVERSVDGLPEKDRVERGLALVRTLIETLARELDNTDLRDQAPVARESILRAVVSRLPDGSPETINSPDIPLLDTTLLTNSPGEPRVGHQILTEIGTAHRIDVVMAFIRRSGIRPFLDAFRRHCERGQLLRILTTTYTSSTELAALEQLKALGAEVRVSYDTSTTRLHAKAWLFVREGGFSTAYVGSSNLTHSALVSGLEWNVRASGARNPDVIEKIGAVFEAYWQSGDFEPFVAEEFKSRSEQDRTAPATLLSPVELRLEPFQERLLEEIEVARERGHHRNLLVAATGTGKTVMAAVDYARLRDELPRARLLFVAHRAEILDQSLGTYRHALRDGSFGELWVGGKHRRNGSTCSRPSRVSRATISTISQPTTLTWSSSTSFITPPRSPTAAFSTTSSLASYSHSRQRPNVRTVSPSSTGSTGRSPRSCGYGTRSTSTGSSRSYTTGSMTESISPKSPGSEAGATTSRA